MSQPYPMMLDLSDRTAVIIGGGQVAARKARGLLSAGVGVLRCVAPSFCDELPDSVQRVPAKYQPCHLDGASLVFAATNSPEVNQAVVRDARARNLPVNRADSDDHQPGDFIVPAVHRSGTVTIAVSAGSPALSAAIRDHLAKALDPRWGLMAMLMSQLRPAIKSARLEIAKRREVFHDLATDEAIGILADQGPDGLRRWLYLRHPELTHA